LASYGKTCLQCGPYFDESGARFLYSDGTGSYCPCGTRLLESVEPEGERHYCLLIPERLEWSAMHWALARQSETRISVEVNTESRFISVIVGG
jgi:hypothetical protein